MDIFLQEQNIDLKKPIVMGILNISPDSFYDGGKYLKDYAKQVEKMLAEGASIIDVGGMTSKPGARIIEEEVEINRMMPVVKDIIKLFPQIILSIDTVHSKVAEACLDAGASIINDISGGAIDDAILDVVARFQVPYICMHMKGIPKNMHIRPTYQDVISEIKQYFEDRITLILLKGVKKIIIDPGFGFGKTISHNFELLNHLDEFSTFNLPLMVGLSRKSMIWKTLHSCPEEALNGTSVLNTIALSKGAQILRVHDVKEAKECIDLYSKLIS